MKIEIQNAGIDAGTELHHFTRCCAGFELGTFRNSIESVSIILGSMQAAIDGKSRRCRVEVELVTGASVSAQASDADLYVAIYWALERAGWSVANRLQREAGAPTRGAARQPGITASAESGRAA